MRKFAILILVVSMLCSVSGFCVLSEETLFDFEDGMQDWHIPNWALEKDNQVGRDIFQSPDWASEGKKSLGMFCEFLPDKWSSAYVEVEDYYNWSSYGKISIDFYLPEDAPNGIKGKIVLTVGEGWKWTEMNKAILLIPGQTTTIAADLRAGSKDWRNTEVDDNLRKDVRKLGVRIESNKIAHKGKVYIDNVRLE